MTAMSYLAIYGIHYPGLAAGGWLSERMWKVEGLFAEANGQHIA